MLKVNAMGDTCPIPVVKTKEAIRQLGADGGVVETLVDNDIAVQNLTKMANQKGYGVESEKLGENEYRVTMTVGAGADLPAESEETACMVPAGQKNTVVVVAADHMGSKTAQNLQKLVCGHIEAHAGVLVRPRVCHLQIFVADLRHFADGLKGVLFHFRAHGIQLNANFQCHSNTAYPFHRITS